MKIQTIGQPYSAYGITDNEARSALVAMVAETPASSLKWNECLQAKPLTKADWVDVVTTIQGMDRITF